MSAKPSLAGEEEENKEEEEEEEEEGGAAATAVAEALGAFGGVLSKTPQSMSSKPSMVAVGRGRGSWGRRRGRRREVRIELEVAPNDACA